MARSKPVLLGFWANEDSLYVLVSQLSDPPGICFLGHYSIWVMFVYEPVTDLSYVRFEEFYSLLILSKCSSSHSGIKGLIPVGGGAVSQYS